MKRTVCIDLDGVLAEYDGWKGEEVVGPPIPGAKEFVWRLVEEGYQVVVHTTRAPVIVREWLAEHGFPMVMVSQIKVPALVYIDDRGHRFSGDWEEAYRAITQPPWWKK